MDTVIYVGGELPDKNAAAHRVLNNAKALREIGYHVVLIGADRDLQWGTPIVSTGQECAGFQTYFTPYPKSGRQWLEYIINASNIIEVCEQQKDVKAVILYNHPSVSMAKMRQYARRNNMKLIADVTEWYLGLYGGLIHRTAKKIDTNFRMKYYKF